MNLTLILGQSCATLCLVSTVGSFVGCPNRLARASKSAFSKFAYQRWSGNSSSSYKPMYICCSQQFATNSPRDSPLWLQCAYVQCFMPPPSMSQGGYPKQKVRRSSWQVRWHAPAILSSKVGRDGRHFSWLCRWQKWKVAFSYFSCTMRWTTNICNEKKMVQERKAWNQVTKVEVKLYLSQHESTLYICLTQHLYLCRFRIWYWFSATHSTLRCPDSGPILPNRTKIRICQ